MLGEQLASHDGCVSAVALRRELERKHGIADARPLVVDVQFFDAESSRERGIPAPSFKFGYLGRSFYSEERHAEELRRQEEATDEKLAWFNTSRRNWKNSTQVISVRRTRILSLTSIPPARAAASKTSI